MLNDKVKVILVSGGKGGVGKSSVTAGLAKGFKAIGKRVGILDADITGPSQSIFFPTNTVFAKDNEISIPTVDGIAVCSMGYFSEEGSSLVWMDETIRSLFHTIFYEANWPEIDILVVDLPPTSGAVTRILLEYFEETYTLFVTTGSILALADLRRDIAYHRRLGSIELGVVNNMAYFFCNECGSKNEISNSMKLSEAEMGINLPVLATYPYDSNVFCEKGCEDLAKRCYERLR